MLALFSVEYTKQQDPHLLMTGIYDASCTRFDNMLVAMSPDAYITAITMGKSVCLFNTENGSLEEMLEEVHGGEMNIDVNNIPRCPTELIRTHLRMDIGQITLSCSDH